jgi:small-conductance mechanosensitive channel
MKTETNKQIKEQIKEQIQVMRCDNNEDAGLKKLLEQILSIENKQKDIHKLFKNG